MSVHYNSKIVSEGLVLCLDAGNAKSYPGSGTTWTDLSSNRKIGTLTNGPTYNSSNGGSIFFDGSNDYVNVSDFNVNHGTGNFSYSCWAYLLAKPAVGTFFENGVYTSGILIRYETNGVRIWAMNTQYSVFNFDPSLSTWNHLTFVRDGNNMLFYLNGKFSQTMSFGTNVNVNPSPAHLFIGTSQHSTNQCFNGRLNLVMVYTAALTASQVLQNFNAHRGRFGL